MNPSADVGGSENVGDSVNVGGSAYAYMCRAHLGRPHVFRTHDLLDEHLNECSEGRKLHIEARARAAETLRKRRELKAAQEAAVAEEIEMRLAAEAREEARRLAAEAQEGEMRLAAEEEERVARDARRAEKKKRQNKVKKLKRQAKEKKLEDNAGGAQS